MYHSHYKIPKMDCPTEEQLIRMKLETIPGIIHLKFGFNRRELEVYHAENFPEIETALQSLNFGAQKISSQLTDQNFKTDEHQQQRRILWWVLGLNFAFFIIEMATGIIAKSMGLIADSLDMLGDAIVYILSLWAVGASIFRQKRVAYISGYFQLFLAGLGLLTIIRRFFSQNEMPDYKIMMAIASFALIANAISLILLQKAKSDEAHMKASMIFTSNDILINLGVIIAGWLVMQTHSKYPDLIIGTLIFILVVQGAFRIIKLSK